MHNTSGNRRSVCPAFTLIEMMIVVTIIALLLTLGVPSFLKALENTYIADCQYRLDNLYQGAEQFAQDNDDELPVLTVGTGSAGYLAPYAEYDPNINSGNIEDQQPEVASFCDKYLGAYAERIGGGDEVRFNYGDGKKMFHPLRCKSSDELYPAGTDDKDPMRYSSYEITGFSRYTGRGGDGYNDPIRTYLSHVKARYVTSNEYPDLPKGRVVLAMDRAWTDGSKLASNHDDGANVLYSDGSCKLVPTKTWAEENWTDEEVREMEVLTEIGAGGVLRPNRSYGWHGSSVDSTTFFFPAAGPYIRSGQDPFMTGRLKSHGAPGNDTVRGVGRGIFY